jgi:hypothetical protein
MNDRFEGIELALPKLVIIQNFEYQWQVPVLRKEITPRHQ